MDFSFINELIKELNNTDIFRYSFTGVKILAFALLSFRLIESFFKTTIDGDNRMGNVFSIAGYAVIIMSSDWIIDSIEDIFSGLDIVMGSTKSDLFFELSDIVQERMDLLFLGADNWWDKVSVFISSIITIIGLLLALILGALFKLADLSITAGYLVQRVFIIQLLKFLFPLAIALSTFSGTQKFFYSWILRYIGVFILGIAYIGIINLSSLIQNILMRQFDVHYGDTMSGETLSISLFSSGLIITVVVVFVIKIKLLNSVTSYVLGMFQ